MIPDPYAIDDGDMIVVEPEDEPNGNSPGHSPKGESRGSRPSRKTPKKVNIAVAK